MFISGGVKSQILYNCDSRLEIKLTHFVYNFQVNKDLRIKYTFISLCDFFQWLDPSKPTSYFTIGLNGFYHLNLGHCCILSPKFKFIFSLSILKNIPFSLS